MISDVLFEAIESIRQYQADFRTYDEIKPRIDQVVAVMDGLRAELDAPPNQ